MADSIVKGHCPSCGPDRFADVVGHYVQKFDEDYVWGQHDFRILKCRGCETPYYQTEKVFSEDTDHVWNQDTHEYDEVLSPNFEHYPLPKRRDEPEWEYRISAKDKTLGNLLSDMYGALNAGLNVPAAVAARTIFDRASEILGVDPAITFGEKLKELAKQGTISDAEKKVLTVLSDAGGAAAHRGWRPKPTEVDTLISIAEAFLHRVFILPADANEVADNIPAKPKRKKKPKS